MIKSMTGFGKAEFIAPERKIIVEIKSLNSKQLDLGVRIPSIYREKESEIRSMISEKLGRGKVDVFINVENIAGAAPANLISEELFKAYYNQIRTISESLSIENRNDIISSVLRMPGVVDNTSIEISDEEWNGLLSATSNAIDAINSFRETEGAHLISDILKHVDKIEALSLSVTQYEKERIDTVRERLNTNLAQLSATVDQNRFEQEIIYYLEKLDITEEKVRLKQHIKYFRETVESGQDVGRKLGFITQEMGREINTTGSKANHTEIQKLVVQMKDELEKIKEQLCNIL